MVKSKAWDWEKVDENAWVEPCEECWYLAEKWKREGVRSILDLGCGKGRHTVFFAKQGFKVTAVDLSEAAVRHTDEWCERENLTVTCKCADMYSLPFATDAFDAVFSYHVISHTDTEGIVKIIAEITRVLKPGGKLYITLCSKEHKTFLDSTNAAMDENTRMKTEGAEKDVPHFFADDAMLPELLKDYELLSVRHTREWFPSIPAHQQKAHYYIEARVKKEPFVN